MTAKRSIAAIVDAASAWKSGRRYGPISGHQALPYTHRSNIMEKPDAVIVDLDGTLLNAQRQCSPRN